MSITKNDKDLIDQINDQLALGRKIQLNSYEKVFNPIIKRIEDLIEKEFPDTYLELYINKDGHEVWWRSQDEK